MQKENTEIEAARMTTENIQFLDVFFAVCKRHKIDYYHATPKQRGCYEAGSTARPDPRGSTTVHGSQAQ